MVKNSRNLLSTMNKDLTNSVIVRQNVLNNMYAVEEIQKAVGVKGILLNSHIAS